jgi:Mor family transcriptional regulator
MVSCSSKDSSSPALLLIQQVAVVGSAGSVSVFFDSGSTGTFITHDAAKRIKARRVRPVKLDLTTTGNVESQHSTYLYEASLVSSSQEVVSILCFGLDQITGKAAKLDLKVIKELFPGIDPDTLQRKSEDVDILIGGELCGLHPREEIASAGDHLKVLKGPFGLCLHGTHPKLRLEGSTESHFSQFTVCTGLQDLKQVNGHLSHPEFQKPQCHLTKAEYAEHMDGFIMGEKLATELSIKCGACRCGKCPVVGHTFSFREEQELQVIRQNLQYDSQAKHWVTKYPWIKDPSELPDNYHAALATLRSTEKTLSKDESWAKIYGEQIMDMVARGVARKLTQKEVEEWKGPSFYISHLAVQNPKSTSTPVRIVFNSSQLHKGVSLNSHLAKGPDAYLNDILGVLLRWREREHVLIGDIRKMYNSIFIEEVEQHCHRFLWRNLENRQPDIYLITRVNMGDRPAAAISSEAIYKTADLFHSEYPEVACLLKNSTYVDDIVESRSSHEEALQLARDTTHVLTEAGFTIKHWLFSGESAPRADLYTPADSVDTAQTIQVLGVTWVPVTDKIVFRAKLNFSKKKKGVYCRPDLSVDQIPKEIPDFLTRRSVLEQVMRIYDPLGLLSPFTLKAKVLLRDTWELKLGWDDPLPSESRANWLKFFQDLVRVESIQYDRCLRPDGAIGDPSLVLMSDASEKAYGFNAYARWELGDGGFSSRLIFSKCRIAPLNRQLSMPQLELNGAVLSKRGRKVLETEMRYNFAATYQLVDSETVLCMINKKSARFRLYEGVRVGEIQTATGGDMSSWFWVSGPKNTADWLTRGRNMLEIGSHSEWFTGPEFLKTDVDEWGIKSYEQCKENIDQISAALHAAEPSATTSLFDYSKYSRLGPYVWCMARIYLALKTKFKRAKTKDITPEVLEKARRLVMRDVQQSSGMANELRTCSSRKKGGKYSQLHPVEDDLGVWIVGTRLLRNNPMAVTPSTLPILLDKDHPITSVIMREAHIDSLHRGRDVTLARFRQEYWTPSGSKLARKIVNDCQKCRLRDVKLLDQKMGTLPVERLLPGPPFNNVMVDFFGPYLVRGEVEKRKSSKAWGVIYTDMCSRAVHVEAAFGYDASTFLLTLKRFTAIRGWPSVIYSDPGSQLVGAEKDLVSMWNSLDCEVTHRICTENGTRWVFGPADSSWHQGVVESLVKAIKRVLKFAINDQRLTPSELMTVFAEAANVINERPLATLQQDPDSPVSILTPNSLLLGRSVAKNPGGWDQDLHLKGRVQVIGKVSHLFWSEWAKVYAPTLVLQRKWKTMRRNLQPGDIVALADSNALRGQYRIAVVREVYPGVDGVVRKVAVAYKNFKVGEKVYEYSGSKDVVITRSIQRLALLVPVDGDGESVE